ncbi:MULTISPECIES: HAD family acid phosphatase [unclassified Streptomyces]|uniref:HAD family acid phosphatase n=1 Tax=unclassified Streptomyces TaxID=2593676 RepID=UPI002DDBA847|nr:MULTISPECIES: HAD family acid phosphatase [unclassified Streptomyces]WSB79253.1 acid phosphatase [Streptomyces sp. NBC_01775]WSS12543.1 acid phosphatase [Streptomyces sp. NBC_01186]WSS41329.1 acid phosphatase [Streptomyces sp. NBC_01187]
MSRSLRTALPLVTVAALAGTALFGIGQATAEHSVPASDKEIPNLDQVKTKIEAYYGDIETEDGEHYASPRGNYAKQVRGIAADARKDIERDLDKYGKAAHGGTKNKPAVVLDVDDTTLLTYNFELRVGYHFSQEAQDEYLRTTDMDPVFGMRELVNWAHKKGVTVFLLTGRKEYQREWSVRNLKKVGYRNPVDKAHFFLKDEKNPPPYLECGSECTTVEYKSGTRAHIEKQGYDILANFGDQYSDLKGGHAARKVKLPNPMYYLP